jgi:hypothetical protein
MRDTQCQLGAQVIRYTENQKLDTLKGFPKLNEIT